jgi:hypothetical protein
MVSSASQTVEDHWGVWADSCRVAVPTAQERSVRTACLLSAYSTLSRITVSHKQRLDVQRLLRHPLLQPPVFVFELAEFLHIDDFQARMFRPPLIARGVRDPVLATELWAPMPA